MNQDWNELLEAALAGDKRAIRRLVDDLTPVVQGSVARVLLQRRPLARSTIRQEMTDFTQGVFEHLFERNGKVLRSFRQDKGSFHGLVATVARNYTLDLLRSQKRLQTAEEPTPDSALERESGPDADPESEAVSRDQLERLLELVRSELDEEDYQLFWWLFVEERSAEEYSEIFHVKPNTVSQWKKRIGDRVRKLLKKMLS